jgi:hypothetical protein
MRLVHLEDVELIVRKTVRSTIDYRSLLTGTPGAIDNFKLILGTTHGDYTTPRHRHNFDQIRLQVGGSFDYDGLGEMTEGMVGYFPEGTPYGPSASGEESRILLYTVIGADGRKRNQDGYEAVWENAYRRPVEYAKPRYDQPIFMRPENFAWVGGSDGASYKLLGDFNERRMRLGFVGLAAGARRVLDSHSLYFVVAGSGRADDAAWRKHTTIHVAAGERVEIRADIDAELFHIGLPDLTGLRHEAPLYAEAR